MRVALTGLVCIPFTPRTLFETWISGSKAKSKTASQAWNGPRTLELRSANCGNNQLHQSLKRRVTVSKKAVQQTTFAYLLVNINWMFSRQSHRLRFNVI